MAAVCEPACPPASAPSTAAAAACVPVSQPHAAPVASGVAPPVAPPGSKEIALDKYAWDQNDKFVTLYVPYEGAAKLGEVRRGSSVRRRAPPVSGRSSVGRSVVVRALDSFHLVPSPRRRPHVRPPVCALC